MALAVSKHIELKTGISIRKFIDESKKVVDGEIFNQMTNKMVTVQAKPNFQNNKVNIKIISTALKGTSRGVIADVQTTNGVVHAIDAVLLP